MVISNSKVSDFPLTGPTRTMRIRVAPNGRLVSGSLQSALPARTTTVPVFSTRALVDLPDGPVRPGATWSRRATAETIGLPLVLSCDTHSRFDRVESMASVRTAVIVTSATFDLGGVKLASPAPRDALAMKFTGTADVTTISWLDLTAHQPVRTEWKANVDATMTVEDSGPAHMTQRIVAERSRVASA